MAEKRLPFIDYSKCFGPKELLSRRRELWIGQINRKNLRSALANHSLSGILDVKNGEAERDEEKKQMKEMLKERRGTIKLHGCGLGPVTQMERDDLVLTAISPMSCQC